VRTQSPDICRELTLVSQGYRFIAGIDEAGRGAWAGPVVAAACILPLERPGLAQELRLVRDSKLLSPRQRDACYDLITMLATFWGAGVVSAAEIDRIGILPATRLAMMQAVSALSQPPELLMIDAVKLPQLAFPQIVEPKSDLHYLSVASASIIAKVTRDRLLVSLDAAYVGYGFAHHKGYGTKQHRAALAELGVCAEHRRSYRPIYDILHAKLLMNPVLRDKQCPNSPTWKR
jgi:ribonuclease HII